MRVLFRILIFILLTMMPSEAQLVRTKTRKDGTRRCSARFLMQRRRVDDLERRRQRASVD